MIGAVELSSVVILGVATLMEWRRGRLTRFLAEAALIGASGWLAEDLCIHLFHFYSYAPGWTLQIDQVPLAVAVIWPFVVLSAREVARALAGDEGRWSTPAVSALIVLFDASLIEPIAVRTGLWSWSESGLWGVPWIGIAGWGVFALLVLACAQVPRRAWTMLAVGPLASNLLLMLLWMGLFRYGPRRDPPPGMELALGVTAGALAWALSWSRRARVDVQVMAPRALAAGLFFALVSRSGDAQLEGYAAAFAAPYLWVTRWSSLRRTPSSRP